MPMKSGNWQPNILIDAISTVLPELDLTLEEVWGHSKIIRFHLKEKGAKDHISLDVAKTALNLDSSLPPLLRICSYPPEDIVVERFGDFLKKKGTQLLTEEAAKSDAFCKQS